MATTKSPEANLDLAAPTRPAIDRAEFSAVMGRMASTVSVVTARVGEEQLGRTVTSAMSLSATPPAVMVSVDIASRLADLIIRAGGFSMAMLARDQQLIGDVFAGKHGHADRFAFGVWSRWPSGNPLLLGAATAIDCELIGRVETQTHVLFAGAIVEADFGNGAEPLLWYQRDYHVPAKPRVREGA